MNEPRVQLQRGRLAGSKDKNLRKKKKFVEQSRKVPKEPDTEKCLKEGIDEKVQHEPNKDDPDD